MTQIAFRADASLEIGNGHVMRCLTLAEALRDEGANCRFVCRDDRGNLIDRIRQGDFEVITIAGTNEPISWDIDARNSLAVLESVGLDLLVVDHYALDARWEAVLRPACRRVMVIDDLADRPHDCDILLDQNLGRSAVAYGPLVPRDSAVLAGPAYTLLRPDFAALRARSLARRRTAALERVLISMGGVDQRNATGRLLDGLRDSGLPGNCRITVVLGPHAPWRASVREQAAGLPWTIEILVDVRNMAALMAGSDLAFGAAGSTSWERCTLGLPTLMLIVADNQREAGKALADSGAAELFEWADMERPALQKLLHPYIADPSRLRRMSDRAAAVCDGGGVSRVVAHIREVLTANGGAA